MNIEKGRWVYQANVGIYTRDCWDQDTTTGDVWTEEVTDMQLVAFWPPGREMGENLLNEAWDYYNKPVAAIPTPQPSPLVDFFRAYYWNEPLKLEPAPACKHEWKEYVGIMNRFDYCVHCDEKKQTI